MYTTLRALHLFLASFSLPFLLMYGVSAVQMTHNEWFQLSPEVRETRVSLIAGLTDARAVAREVLQHGGDVEGELTGVQSVPTGHTFRLVLPGTVHEIRYDRLTGATTIKTSVAGTLGMLNRLHHAAGFWHEPPVMKAWAVVVLIVSEALLVLGATGISMWFLRRSERAIGAVLLSINLLFVLTLLVMMRVQGP